MDKELDKTTIMVVDDTPANLNILQEMLQVKGYRVLAFPDGEMALSAAAKSPPDLILLDIIMPEINGFEVCERLKADESLKDIPVLFISALSETADKIKAFSVGGVDYVTKPFQIEEVHARVHAHLEIVRQKRELQATYNELLDLETLRDSLVNMIVHDMRSPLFAILGNLELAQMEPLPKYAADCIDDTLSSTVTLVEMVSSLLDVSKMEARQMKLEFSSVDMRVLGSEAIRMVEHLKGQRTITLTSPREMAAFACAAGLIGRVLQNLIGNALKFTDKENGIITVSIGITAENKVRVSVADNGPGIPLEYHKKVFDKFFRVTASKQRQVNSTGLGLTFCKLAVETHGGQIGLESKVGQGSTFWFELPQSQEAANADGAGPPMPSSYLLPG